MNPKISTIIVVFNDAETIGDSIESVLTQDYNNKELIVIDGGSTDGTLQILEGIKNQNFFWISEPDKGIYDAMNKGIKKASGEWIYFLGADDSFHNKSVLRNIFKDSDFSKIDFLYGNVKRSDSNRLYDREFDFEKLLKKNISHQAIFYSREIFEKIGNYDLRFKTHADWDLNLRCFQKGIPVKYIDVIVADFKAGGASSDYDIPFLRESLLPLKLSFLKENKKALLHLKNYDEYWRFLRNAEIKDEDDFHKSKHFSPVPDAILSMVKWQRKIPGSLLRTGVFSKAAMFANFLFNYNKIRH